MDVLGSGTEGAAIGSEAVSSGAGSQQQRGDH